MRTALVQEYLTQDGGAEVVFRELARLLPEADLYAFFSNAPALAGRPVHESWVAPVAKRMRNYRILFPLFPSLARSLPVGRYDVVITSSFGLAKSVRISPEQLHVCYCHTPPRWLWDMSEDYVESMDKGRLVKAIVRRLFKQLQASDLAGGRRVDHFVANSQFVADRIQRVYGKEAVVIHPPVHIERFKPAAVRRDYYFTLSRLVPYKRVDFLVEAFRLMPDRKLVVGGSGPELTRLRAIAPPNVQILGRISDDDVVRRMGETKAFLFAAEEDFGIAPVEAQAAGTPVVAYGRGGVLESVIEGKTGVFFGEYEPQSLKGALERLDALSLDRDVIRGNAERFSAHVFRERMAQFLVAVGLPVRT